MSSIAIDRDKSCLVLLANVIAYTALAIVTNLLSGIGGTVPKYVGWGTGAGVSARSNTTLFTEAYSSSNTGSQNTRVTGVVTRTSAGGQTNDTMQVVATLTCPAALAPLAITNAGIFDTNGLAADLVTAPSGGNLFLKSDFGTVTLSSGDTLQLTFTYTLS